MSKDKSLRFSCIRSFFRKEPNRGIVRRKENYGPRRVTSIVTVSSVKKEVASYVSSNRKTRQANFTTMRSMFWTWSDKNKADYLLSDKHPHFWYFRMSKKCGSSVSKAISKLTKDKPWNLAKQGKFSSFEDLRTHIDNLIRMPYIGDLVIYDVSLVIAYAVNNPLLLPQKYVYIHAKPKRNAKIVFPFILPEIPIKGNCIDYSILPPYLKKLTADEVEDFLCIYP